MTRDSPPKAASVTTETQQGLLALLAAAAEQYAAASLALRLTRELDAQRLVTFGRLAAIADAALRLTPRAQPSVVARHYAGAAKGPLGAWGLHGGGLEGESAVLQLTEPEAAVARSMILEYFASVERLVPAERRLFAWEKGDRFGEAELAFVEQVGLELGFVEAHEGHRAAPLLLSGDLPELLRLCPELGSFRDLAFLYRLFLCSTQESLPARQRYTPRQAILSWAVHPAGREEKLEVRGFGRSLQIEPAEAGDKKGNWFTKIFAGKKAPRAPPSGAVPGALVPSKTALVTEEQLVDVPSTLFEDTAPSADPMGLRAQAAS